MGLAERLAQRGNVLREAVFFHHHARPDRAEQGVLVEHFAGMLREVQQRVEDLRIERDRLARVASQ